MKKKKFLTNLKSIEGILIGVVFLISFAYLITVPPFFSPDTFSYLRADINRYPGYILTIRGFQFLFGESYPVLLVGFHVLFSFISISIVYTNCKKLFRLKTPARILLFLLLLFPLFPPLAIVTELCSEGISYPLYLLLISFTLDFLYKDQFKKLYYLCGVFILLTLTRGQFIVVPLIIAFVYLLKNWREVFRRKHILTLILLVLLPSIVGTIDSTFRKIVYGFYVTTPYSYVNAVALPLYVSKIGDSVDIEDEHHRALFIKSIKRIDSLNLIGSKVDGTYKDKYAVFHDNFPKICNQNIHAQGKAYYYTKDSIPHESGIKTELASKAMFPVLIKNNFKDWGSLYYAGIVNGLYSVFILISLIVLIAIYLWKSIKKFKIENSFILLSSLLLLSNSMIVAVACHSVMRYLFYNFFLGLIILVILLRKIKLNR